MIDGKPHFTQKAERAWFIVGFPKGNVPRLEADISGLCVLIDDEGQRDQYEVYFTNVIEVTENQSLATRTRCKNESLYTL